MSLYRRGRVWYYDFEFNGARYNASTRQVKLTVAKEIEGRRLRELREGLSSGQAIEDISFEDLTAKFLKRHVRGKRAPEFYEYALKVIKPHFEKRMLSQITAGDVDEFMAKRRSEVAASTANRSLSVLKTMFRLA